MKNPRKSIDLISLNDIQDKIFTIRNVQVMIDRDLADLYGVKTKRLNEQVKRNIDRFPNEFRFTLSNKEKNELVANCDRLKNLKHSSVNPNAFTEQGVAMLSAVLKSDLAIQVSVGIIRAFVRMRRFTINNTGIFQRLESVGRKQIEANENIQKLFEALEDKTLKPKQGILYNGQVFDAYRLVRKIIKSAKQSITLIDNYVNEDTLYLFSDLKKDIKCKIHTPVITKKLKLDLKKFNQQNNPITIHKFNKSHDRFIIIDNKTLYHFGASLKDLGKKWFAFSKFDAKNLEIIKRISK